MNKHVLQFLRNLAMMARSLQDLTAQYPVLNCLSSWLSTLDLYRLSLTSKHVYNHILASKSVFETLKRTTLCDGHGLQKRQDFDGPYRTANWSLWFGHAPRVEQNEPIEVKLWNLKCDEAGALPCRRCGFNSCEECRRYQREPYEYVDGSRSAATIGTFFHRQRDADQLTQIAVRKSMVPEQA